MNAKVTMARDGGVMTLQFNRPEKKNALDRDMYGALIAALDEAAAEDALRAVIFCGAGGVFTAGNDLQDFIAALGALDEFPALRFVKTIAAFPKPMIAAVTGDAIGVGTTLLLHCDLVYAAPEARFRTPFVDLGLVPEAGASLLAPRLMGQAKAAQYLLLGEAFDAAEALALGLVNQVAPADEVLALAQRAAQRLAQKPREALLAARRLMRGDPKEILAQIDAEAAAFAKALQSEETRARFAAFFAAKAK
jgi:enoyl-CoA hydratase/carnithine racemase